MTPNQQEEILKTFESCNYIKEWDFPLDKYESGEYTHPDTQALFLGFKEAYTLQQEKIEKLEKEKIEAIAICKSQFDIVKTERDRLKKFCDEFVYGEENPEYYKTMDEKIENLEKELHNERISRVNSDAFYENIIAEKNKSLEQQKFNNAHNLSIDQQIADKIESLKSDLDWVLNNANAYHLTPSDRNRFEEIRQRHCLGKSEEA